MPVGGFYSFCVWSAELVEGLTLLFGKGKLLVWEMCLCVVSVHGQTDL